MPRRPARDGLPAGHNGRLCPMAFEGDRMTVRIHIRPPALVLAALLATGAGAQGAATAAEAAAKEAGAQTPPSGLIYRSLQDGTGASPGASDKVKVHYRGTLLDGKEFDSSYKRNAPIEFPLNGVIPCW